MGKTIEVDEDTWNQNQKLRETLANIARNPQAARLLEQAHKTAQPNVATPLADADKQVTEPLTELRKEFSEFRKGFEDERQKEKEERERIAATAKWEAGRKWMLERGFTAEGIDKIEKDLMAPRGIANHEDAAVLWEKEHPTPPPAMPGGTGAFNFLEQPQDNTNESIKKLIESRGQDNLAADRMARDALNEFRQQVSQAANGRR